MNILLVQGWFTYDGFNYGGLIGKYYKEFIKHIEKKGTVVPFSYKDDERISDIIINLSKFINSNAFTHIIGHSMGGGLILQLMKSNFDFKDSKIIFCQSYITYQNLLYKSSKIVSKIPFYYHIKSPVILIEPSFYLQYNYSLCQDINNIPKNVHIHQFVDITLMMPENVVDVLKKYHNVVSIIYSYDDNLCPIDDENLLQLLKWNNGINTNFVIIQSRHMPTWDNKIIQDIFYYTIDKFLI